jgi:hypothetical protein
MIHEKLAFKMPLIQNPIDHNFPLEFFINTKCGFDPVWKLFIVVFSHIQYCGYTMPRVAMISTLGNL